MSGSASSLRDSAVGEKITSAIGDMAGAVADPKTGMQHLKQKATSPMMLAIAAALLGAYLLGRRARQH